MKEFLKQLGFEDITNSPKTKYQKVYFDWDKAYDGVYRRSSDNGVISYIMYGFEGGRYWVDIVSKYGYKRMKAHQLAPGEYIKDIISKLLLEVETKVQQRYLNGPVQQADELIKQLKNQSKKL